MPLSKKVSLANELLGKGRSERECGHCRQKEGKQASGEDLYGACHKRNLGQSIPLTQGGKVEIHGDGVAFSRSHFHSRGIGLMRLADQMRRGMLGKSSQTLTPQKCEPSVQIGVVIPARK